MSEPHSNSKFTHDITATACVQLFSDYGVELTARDVSMATTSHTQLHVGIIGFTGDGVRGTLVLGSSEGPLRESNPVKGVRLERHWIAELSNQLLGRIKTEYLARGAPIYLTTPVVLRGENIAALPRLEQEPMIFETKDGMVYAWIDAEFDDGFSLAEVADEADLGLREGSSLMF